MEWNRKPINQGYFDLESRSELELKKTYYTLGLFYSGYSPFRENGVIYRSEIGDLAEIVKRELGSSHTIHTDKYSRYIKVEYAPHLRARLDDLGLQKDKQKRVFPKNVPNYCLSHFVRGFVEGRARIYSFPRTTELRMSFNQDFLATLHSVLVFNAGIKRNYSRGKLNYSGEDARRVFDFIYSDLEFIEQHSIYLPSFKNSLGNSTSKKPPPIKKKQIRLERVKRAKSMIVSGLNPRDIYSLLGFKTLGGFYNAFRSVAGMNPLEFLSSNEAESEREKRRLNGALDRIKGIQVHKVTIK